MKQPPKYTKIQEQMEKGHLSLTGFLGKDTRPLIDILLEDHETVNQLGLTHEKIAVRMNELLKIGLQRYGEYVIVDHDLEILVEESRGRIPCPFNHPGLYSKIQVTAIHHGLNKEFHWSALSIHLIKEHGFYQGKGSEYRIDPTEIAYFLKLK